MCNINKRIFVYGSLLENFYNYNKYLVGKVEKKSCGRTFGKLYHLNLKGYPAMIKGTDLIYGEIFQISDWNAIIASLDELEGYFGEGNPRNIYNRVLIEVLELPQKTNQLAYAYIYNCKDELELVNEIYLPEGNWKSFMEKSNK